MEMGYNEDAYRLGSPLGVGGKLGKLRLLPPSASSSSAWAEFSSSAGTFHVPYSPAWILQFLFSLSLKSL